MPSKKARLAAEWGQIKVEKYGGPKSVRTSEKKPARMLTAHEASHRPKANSFSRVITDEILGNLPIQRTRLLDSHIEDLVSSQLRSDRFESRRACIRATELVRERDEEILKLRRELKRYHEQLEDALAKVKDLKLELSVRKKISQSSAKAFSSP